MNLNLNQRFCITGCDLPDEWKKLLVTFCPLVTCGENENEALERMDYQGQGCVFLYINAGNTSF